MTTKAMEKRIKLVDASALLTESDQDFILGYMQAIVDHKLTPRKRKRKGGVNEVSKAGYEY